MKAAFDAIAYWLIDFYLAATIILIVVAVAQRVISQPARRLALHWGALIGLSLLVFLCLLPGWPRIDVAGIAGAIPELSSSTRRLSAVSTSPRDHSVPPANQDASADSSTAQSSTGAPTVVRSNGVSPVPRAATLASTARGLWQWFSKRDLGPVRLVALVLFAIGCALTTFRVIHGVFAARRVRRSALRAPRRVVAVLEKLVGQGRCPELLVARSHPIPIVTGALNPKILLPLQFAERERPDDCRSVLAHELAHIHNGDLWLLALDRWLLPLLWMHPLYLRLRRSLRDDQELLADSYAAIHSSRTDYADMLLRWARRLAAEKRARQLAAAVGVWDRPSRLHDRISRLLQPSQRLELCCSRAWRMGSLLLLLTLPILLSTATVSLRAPRLSDVLASWSTEAKVAGPATFWRRRWSVEPVSRHHPCVREQLAIAAVRQHGVSMQGGRIDGNWYVIGVDTRYRESGHRVRNNPFPGPDCRKQNKVCPDAVLPHLAGFAHLKYLTIAREQVTDSGMRQISALRKLEVLTLEDAHRLTAAGLAELTKLPRLRHLSITNAKFDDVAFEKLCAAPQLNQLSIAGSNLSEKAVEVASHMPRLRQLALELPNRLIGRDALSSLHALPRLRHLSLCCSEIPDESLMAVRSLTGLRSLSLCSHVNTDALATLRRSLPSLAVRCYPGTRMRSATSAGQTNDDTPRAGDVVADASGSATPVEDVANQPAHGPAGPQSQALSLHIRPSLTDRELTLSFTDSKLAVAVSREFTLHLDSSLVFKCRLCRVGHDWKIVACDVSPAHDGVEEPHGPLASGYLKGRAIKEWSGPIEARTID